MSIENQICLPEYFKHSRSVEKILLEEFAFSLIYNNIAPDKIDIALKSVGLNKLPNIFFLIQIDDYSNESKRLTIENEFVMKVRIIDIVCACLKRNDIVHAAANLTGTDKVIAFLSLDDTVCDNELVRVSKEICEKVHLFTNYSVSVCISDRCTNLSAFPKSYERTNAMLKESFFLGKKIQTSVVNVEQNAKAKQEIAETGRFMQNIYVAVSKGNRILFGQTMVQLFSTLRENGRSREQSLLLVEKIIDKMGEYTISCGVENEKCVTEIALNSKEAMLSCHYADDVCLVLMEYYESLCGMLEMRRDRSSNDCFRETVQQYVKDHFKERIYLDEIASSCGYNKYYFCRQFRVCFDMGLSNYVNRYRIEQAKKLLHEGHCSIEDIVREVGFSSANYFEIVFRKNVGVSPTTYKKTRSM